MSYSYRTYSYSKFSPTLYHNLVHLSGTTRRRREPISSINEVNHLTVCLALKWFVPQTPYLIHEYTKAPNITGRGVLLVVKCLIVVVVACEQTIVHTIRFIYVPQELSTSQESFLPETHSSHHQISLWTFQNQLSVECDCLDCIAKITSIVVKLTPCMSFHHPPGCSWQQGLCVQSSSWTGTPYLRQSDDNIPAAVEVVMVVPSLLDCVII